MSNKSKVLIEVSGGIAEHSMTDGDEVDVIVLDWDNIEAGDEPPLERPKKSDGSELAAKMRQAWEKYDECHKEDEG